MPLINYVVTHPEWKNGGAIYGGSRSAILLNIPGTPASAASCLDGYALARKGLAGRAMGIATSGSARAKPRMPNSTNMMT